MGTTKMDEVLDFRNEGKRGILSVSSENTLKVFWFLIKFEILKYGLKILIFSFIISLLVFSFLKDEGKIILSLIIFSLLLIIFTIFYIKHKKQNEEVV